MNADFQPSVLAPGALIGPYRIEQFIARGGMGVVYRAKHRTLKEDVALKVLYPHLIGEGDFAVRFQREGAAMARLRHPHIAQVFNADVANGYHYLALEFAPGGTLRQLLDRSPRKQLPLDQALAITRQMALALYYAHTNGVIHRDIKPSNILIAPGPRFMLIDFGVAHMATEPKITRNMASMGTPEYMSPEQGQGLKVDARSDIYSLGILLYELLAGRPPFQSDTHLATLFQHAKETPTQINRYRPDVPAPVRAIVHKALAKHPKDRFQSAAEMAQAIERAMAGKPKPSAARAVLMSVLGVVAVMSLAVAGVLLVRGLSTPVEAARNGGAPVVAQKPTTLPTRAQAAVVQASATLVPVTAPATLLATDAPTGAPTMIPTTLTPLPTLQPTALVTPTAPPATPLATAETSGSALAATEVAVVAPTAAPTNAPTAMPAVPTAVPPPTDVPVQPTAAPTTRPVPTRVPTRTPGPTRTPAPAGARPTALPKLQGALTLSANVSAMRWQRPVPWDEGNTNLCSYINTRGDPNRVPLWRIDINVRLKNTANAATTVSGANWVLLARNKYVMRACFGSVQVPAKGEASITIKGFFEKDKLVPYRLELAGTNQAVCFVPTGNVDDISRESLGFVVEKCR